VPLPIKGKKREAIMEVADEKLKEEIMSFARRYVSSGIVGIVGCFATISREVREKYGSEGEKLLEQACHDVGAKIGLSWKEKLSIANGDLNELDKVLTGMARDIGWEYSIVKTSRSRRVARVTFCPYLKGWKMLDAPPYVCDLWGFFLSGVSESVNPKITFRYNASMHKGDPYCEMVFEMRA
jgi:hypothetical protein